MGNSESHVFAAELPVILTGYLATKNKVVSLGYRLNQLMTPTGGLFCIMAEITFVSTTIIQMSLVNHAHAQVSEVRTAQLQQ